MFLKVFAEEVVKQVGENSYYFQGICSPVVPLEHSLLLLCTGGTCRAFLNLALCCPLTLGINAATDTAQRSSQ